jgi:hypothetical protein
LKSKDLIISSHQHQILFPSTFPPAPSVSSEINMSRIAALLVLAMVVNDTFAFTISLVPLLTRLGPFGSHFTNQFSQAAPSSILSPPSDVIGRPTTPQSSVVKPRKFKFEYMDAHMISDCKSEIMEYVYAKSLDRGFV